MGTASDALVRYMLEHNPAIGETTGTVNPLVLECNDGAYLNDIRGQHVKAGDHVLNCLEGARSPFVRKGRFGAGTGMSCYGLKGGHWIGLPAGKFQIGNQDRYHLACPDPLQYGPAGRSY